MKVANPGSCDETKVKVANPGSCDETKVKVPSALNRAYLKNRGFLKNKAYLSTLCYLNNQLWTQLQVNSCINNCWVLDEDA